MTLLSRLITALDFFPSFPAIIIFNLWLIKAMGKIIILPTSHIAGQSLREVRELLEREKPDCVALELDLNRFYAMQAEKKQGSLQTLKLLGPVTFLFYWVLKKLQKWLGGKTGILPGSEMLQGVRVAGELGLKIAFIDQDIRTTILRLKDKVGWREKLKLIWFVLKGLTLGFIKREKIDLQKVPEKKIIREAMLLLKREFPQLYGVLVSDRDIVMAKRLKMLSKRFKKTVAIVGAGHEEGLRRFIKYQKPS